MHRIFAVRSHNVVSETIDGELIILDLAAGTYHATEGAGAALWELAVAGLDEEQILAACQSAWPTVQGKEDARAFLEHLVAVGLLTVSDGGSMTGKPHDFLNVGHVAWAPPVLKSYDDMTDMIQLDPIHDVTESGWPTARSVQ